MGVDETLNFAVHSWMILVSLSNKYLINLRFTIKTLRSLFSTNVFISTNGNSLLWKKNIFFHCQCFLELAAIRQLLVIQIFKGNTLTNYLTFIVIEHRRIGADDTFFTGYPVVTWAGLT